MRRHHVEASTDHLPRQEIDRDHNGTDTGDAIRGAALPPGVDRNDLTVFGGPADPLPRRRGGPHSASEPCRVCNEENRQGDPTGARPAPTSQISRPLGGQDDLRYELAVRVIGRVSQRHQQRRCRRMSVSLDQRLVDATKHRSDWVGALAHLGHTDTDA